MASSFSEAFAKMDLSSLPEGDGISEEQYRAEQQIEFYEALLKMGERNASEKEFHNFAKKYGFCSKKHMFLYINIVDKLNDLEETFNDVRDYSSKETNDFYESQIRDLRNKRESLRSCSYYRMLIRVTNIKDVTPYREDVGKRKAYDENHESGMIASFL